MPNNVRYLGLVLFILGSWLAIVVVVFILLDSRFSRILMAVDEVECSVVEPLTLSWGVQICRSFCLASHWCEVFGRVIEVLPMRQCLLTDLKISSQAIEYLVVGDCKSASPGRNKVNVLTEPLIWTKGKTFVRILLPSQLDRFEDVLPKFAPYCVAKLQVYLGYNVQ
jgi:hypothetical protein